MRSARTCLLALVAILAACGAPVDRPLNVCELEDLVARVPRPLFSGEVDLLFVIDNSAGMAEEQALLAAEMPRLITSLASGESPSGNFVNVSDLRVGVVTTDMGTGGFSVSTCTEPHFGDDGTLQRSTLIRSGAPPFLNLRRGEVSSPDGVGSLLQIGTSGCGFRQPLEAALKALTPAGSDTLFVSGTTGHADGANEGFLRHDSLLAVVVLSNHDDCSAANPDIYNRESDIYTDPNLGLRCSRYSGASTGTLHQAERYIDGLLSLRTPDQLVFALIGGVPEDLAHAPGESPDFSALIGPDADPRMRAVIDPSMPSQLTPSCEHEEQGSAFPPSRLVGVAEGLAQRRAQVVVQSLCQDDYAPVTDALLAGFANALGSWCINGPLEDGTVGCEVVESLPLGGASCDELEGRVFRELHAESGREICTVCQVSADGVPVDGQPGCQSGAGWFYEEGAAHCPAERAQSFSFTENAVPGAGAILRFRCEPDEVTLGTGCEADPTICDESVVAGVTCDASLHQCLFACSTDAECMSTLGGGYACYDPDEDGRGSCVNPTCAP